MANPLPTSPRPRRTVAKIVASHVALHHHHPPSSETLHTSEPKKPFTTFSSFIKNLISQGRCFCCFYRGHRLTQCKDPLRCFRCLGVVHKGNHCPGVGHKGNHCTLQDTPHQHFPASSRATPVTPINPTEPALPPLPLHPPHTSLPTLTPPPDRPTEPEDEVNKYIHPSEEGFANHFTLLKAALLEVNSGAVTETQVLSLLQTEIGSDFKFMVRKHSMGNYLVIFPFRELLEDACRRFHHTTRLSLDWVVEWRLTRWLEVQKGIPCEPSET